MKNELEYDGYKRFNNQIIKLESLLDLAFQSQNPALSLYKSSARSVLFYLEALCRLYKNMHNRNRFEKLLDDFKSLEDQLGKIDYYDAFIKEFTAQKNFPNALLNNLKEHYNSELKKLEEILCEKQWIDKEKTKLGIIQKKLKDASWKSTKKDSKEIAKIIIKDIDEIESDYKSEKLNFKTLENGVHEYRRQIRWISIYAQVLDGLIQLKASDKPLPELDRYLTPEILNSPFNILPKEKEGLKPIYIELGYFYALSWLVSESGKLKDEGLRIICIEETIKETGFVEDSKHKELTKSLAINSHKSPKQIKEEMKVIAEYFMSNVKVLSHIKQNIEQFNH